MGDRKTFRQQRKRFFLVSISFRLVLLLAAGALLLSYLALFVNPVHFPLPAFFGMFFIPIAAINLFLFLVALIRRSRSAWIPLVILLPSLLFLDSYVHLGNKQVNEVRGTQGLRMMTYNVGQFAVHKDELDRRACQQHILDYIRQEQPDVVCMQEFYISDTSRLHTILKEYPYRHKHFFRLRSGAWFGNLTVSRYPIVDQGRISFKGSTNLSIWTDIQLGKEIIRFYNNHLESFNISFSAIIKNLSRGGSEIISEEWNQLQTKMTRSNLRRVEQVDVVLEHIAQSPYPAVVCGDFNDTPMSYTYRQLSRGRKDTFIEAGEYLAGTYATFWPLLRIDYVLVPESYYVLHHRTPRLEWSDHYPVVTDLSVYSSVL